MSNAPWYCSFVATVVTLLAGGLLTRIGPWYRSLSMPPWKPPDWAFGPVWTTIGICTAISGVLAWRAAPPGGGTLVLVLFGLNAVLNMIWSLLFFALRRPDWALGEVGLLWLSILAPMLLLRSAYHVASLLLLPYLIWVATAACLNYAVVRRNAPFGPVASKNNGMAAAHE